MYRWPVHKDEILLAWVGVECHFHALQPRYPWHSQSKCCTSCARGGTKKQAGHEGLTLALRAWSGLYVASSLHGLTRLPRLQVDIILLFSVFVAMKLRSFSWWLWSWMIFCCLSVHSQANQALHEDPRQWWRCTAGHANPCLSTG
jgi:hypothetical protein